MCGRYSLVRLQGITKRFLVEKDRANVEKLASLFNLAPTEPAPVVIEEGETRIAISALFGLIPFWAKDAKIASQCINARAESVAERPAFRESFRRRRCLVPSDGYFEWQTEGKSRLPWRVVRKDGDLFAFAGLWDKSNGSKGETHSFTIITTETNGLTKQFHDRMPVILSRENESLWLAPYVTEPRTLTPLLKPYPADEMDLYRVTPDMNKAVFKDARAVERILQPSPSSDLFD
ncbi:MAG: SOS response-associated peptidase [Acidobacteria bacterium]|nr:SOS response-associated peptidase [Acidobacteriota bacterium]